MAETKVFVSYRRADAQYVAPQLRERLTTAFGTDAVFFDAVSIRLGEDFRTKIRTEIRGTDAVLVLVGSRFRPERLAADDDPVRLEIAEALRQQKLVVPVLLEDAEMPSPDNVPDELRPFCGLNAARLRPYPDFDADTTRLIDALAAYEPDLAPPEPSEVPAPGPEPEPEPERSNVIPLVRKRDPAAPPDATPTPDDAGTTETSPSEEAGAFTVVGFLVGAVMAAIATWMVVGIGPGTGELVQPSLRETAGMVLLGLAALCVLVPPCVTLGATSETDTVGTNLGAGLGFTIFAGLLVWLATAVCLEVGTFGVWRWLLLAVVVYVVLTSSPEKGAGMTLLADVGGGALVVAVGAVFLGTAQALVGDTGGFFGILGRLVEGSFGGG